MEVNRLEDLINYAIDKKINEYYYKLDNVTDMVLHPELYAKLIKNDYFRYHVSHLRRPYYIHAIVMLDERCVKNRITFVDKKGNKVTFEVQK